MATSKQIKFIEDLLLDCGLYDRVKRNAYLNSEIPLHAQLQGQEIRYLDDLSTAEAHFIIERLIDYRDNSFDNKARDRIHDPNDDYIK